MDVGHRRVRVPAVLQRARAGLLGEQIDARPRRQQPAPDNARDDEGHGHREEVDAPEEALAADLPVDERGQHKADDQATHHEEQREDDGVPDIDLEAEVIEQRTEIVKAHERVVRPYRIPLAHGDQRAPADEAVHEDGDSQHRGHDEPDGQCLVAEGRARNAAKPGQPAFPVDACCCPGLAHR
jgi:hypothetical protein